MADLGLILFKSIREIGRIYASLFAYSACDFIVWRFAVWVAFASANFASLIAEQVAGITLAGLLPRVLHVITNPCWRCWQAGMCGRVSLGDLVCHSIVTHLASSLSSANELAQSERRYS